MVFKKAALKKAIGGVVLAAVCALGSPAVHAGPREECAATGATMPCLDAKLKDANKKLNVTLKAAQERLEQIQARGGRPMLGAFVDSQRKFNAYRDAQCSWQGVRAAPTENTAEYVRECQLVATLVREEDLAAFAGNEEHEAVAVVAVPSAPEVAAVQPPPAAADIPAPVTVDPAPPQAAAPVPPPQGSAGSRGVEWRLLTWVVGGQQKQLLQDSTISIAFDPSGKIAGNATVNRFTGTYSFDADGRLKWPPSGFSMTRMAGPPALMAQERAFLESLRRTSRYKVEDQQLILESANSSVVLAFTR